MSCTEASNALHAMADSALALRSNRFFKTGKGEYAEGEQFLGVTTPNVRKLVPIFSSLAHGSIHELLQSVYNEERLFGLFILHEKYKSGNEDEKNSVYSFYLNHLDRVNNWNLVDSSAYKLVGEHLLTRNRDILYELVKSESIWPRRVAIVCTLAFIKNDQYEDTLNLCEKLLDDPQDLMHKACGWMLREVGKRNTYVLERFLLQHRKAMPKVMLRYAVEKLPDKKRKAHLIAGSEK
eukprot:gene1933-3750_t